MVVLACLALLIVTTVIHYEVLRGLSLLLPTLTIRPRARLLVVIFSTFFAHIVEIALYALVVYALVQWGGYGTLDESSRFSLDVSLYFSAETYTSLGYGDVVPGGAVRLLAGVEALHGLLLIGWSASYTYIAMERFWRDSNGQGG